MLNIPVTTRKRQAVGVLDWLDGLARRATAIAPEEQ